MPTLIIDNQTITVAEGTNLLEAAQQLGIVVPHFCYHRALGEVGACRMCAVYVETEKGAGLEMACMVAAEQGMVVSTGHPEAMEFRAHVGEWLMMNHPHDCPVCDEGGECQLQEMTIASGHSRRRYRGNKRTWQNQDLGPHIEQEMNRCIQCYRCVRTYRDYFGGTDFGVLGSRQRLFFGRFRPGPLESGFSGNLVDVCPTGVFTDKTFRFKSRSWDLQEAESICPHCGLGCSVIPGARFRELQRIRAGINEQVNGFFICDRGRFGNHFVNHPDRPRQPLLHKQPVDWDKALMRLQVELGRIQKEQGKDAVACLGSSRASLEANALLKGWADANAARVVFDCLPHRDRASRQLANRLGSVGRSLQQIRASDLLVIFACDPLSEAPMLASAIRQAARKGAGIILCSPQPLDLTTEAQHIPIADQDLQAALRELATGTPKRPELNELRDRLAAAERPILIGGGNRLDAEGIGVLLQVAELAAGGLHVLLDGPNSFGTGLLAGDDTFDDLLTGIEAGNIRALLCLETDPLTEVADQERLAAALQQLELLVVLDHRAGGAAAAAHILLPTTAPFESAGVFVNNEGRLQAFAPVMPPGQPLAQTSGGDHPPRSFSHNTPGAEPLPAATILARLLRHDESIAAIRRRLATDDPRLQNITGLSPGDGGRLLDDPTGGAS